ncbi:MAG: GspE/PulE family protein [Nitrospinales bacterium]
MATREKLRLGDVLVQAGAITKEQLEEALRIQKTSGERLGKTLVRIRFLTEDKLADSLAKQLKIPYVDLREIKINQAAIKKVEQNIAEKHTLIPIAIQDGQLTVAMADPLNIFAIDEVTIHSGMDVKPAVSPGEDIEHAIQEYYGVAASIEAAMKSIGVLDAKKQEAQAVLEDQPAAAALEVSETPVAKLVEVILKQALDDGASDIHIEPTEDDLNIRYRIDGVLFEATHPPKSVESALISRIKVMSNLDIAETRAPQDGGFSIKLGAKEIELRVSTCPTIYGENMVLRILDKSKLMVDLKTSGLMGSSLEKYQTLLKKPYGVILVTGPTGSGKTTTLYASLNLLDCKTKNIKTIEDPVEYRLPGIRQTQVNPKAGITFATGLRSLMRQDPDIIMVGEIRDGETSDIAIQAALTGHLVLSTLHTNDTAGALSRLSDLGAEPFLLASSIVGVLAQRLARRICQNCKTKYELGPDELKQLFPKGTDKKVLLSRGEGCRQCKRSGYQGRIGIFEVLMVTDDIRALILKQAAPMTILKAARQTQGLRTLRYDALQKVLNGYTTLEEVNRVTFAE